MKLLVLSTMCLLQVSLVLASAASNVKQISAQSLALEDQSTNSRVRLKRQISKYLEVENVTTTYFNGDPMVKSSYFDCAQGENCTIKGTFQHSESVRHSGSFGFKMEAGTLLELHPSVSVDRSAGKAVSTQYNFQMAGQSRARLIFRPKMMKINGVLVRKKRCLERSERILGGILTLGASELLNKGVPECEDHDLGPYELIAPVSSHRGDHINELDGEWYVEYSDNPMPVDDLNYHNIRDRDLTELPDDIKMDRTVANPIMCGNYAKAYGYKLAVYKNATCHLKKTVSNSETEIYTGKGVFIGEYALENHNSNMTLSEAGKNYWVKHRMCDMIDYKNGHYRCKKLAHKTRAVVLFKKLNEKSTPTDDGFAGEPIEN